MKEKKNLLLILDATVEGLLLDQSLVSSVLY